MRLLGPALAVISALSFWQPRALAQTQASTCAQSSGQANTLYCIPILSTENAYLLPPAGAENFVVQKGFVPATSAVGAQLSTLPSPTPSSGLIFSFGAQGLTAERELGPIYSYAPWTVGRRKLYLAFAYQYFDFDKVNSVPFNNIPLELTACNNPTSAACGKPFVQTNSHYGLHLNEYIGYASVGITNRLEASVMVPFVSSRASISTTCSVCFEQLDYATPTTLGFIPNSSKGTSGGIGDVVLGFKATAWKSERAGLALGVDVRTPSGDAYNFHGAGTFGVSPYIALGYKSRVSPHVNLGGWINGDSILASTDGVTRQHLPDSIVYSGGLDFAATRRFSISGDLLGQVFFDSGTVAIDSTGLALHATTQTYNTNTAALGLKGVPVKRLLVSANVLVKVDNNGLHYNPSPMAGISYTF